MHYLKIRRKVYRSIAADTNHCICIDEIQSQQKNTGKGRKETTRRVSNIVKRKSGDADACKIFSHPSAVLLY